MYDRWDSRFPRPEANAESMEEDGRRSDAKTGCIVGTQGSDTCEETGSDQGKPGRG
jgi:hypothetical protein